jgi:hypothetical protein
MNDSDRRSIGLTAESQRLMDEIMARDWFTEPQAVARFAMACALRAGIVPGTTPGVDTRWNSGLFDPTGELLAIIGAFHPSVKTPVRAAESLVNEGLKIVHADLVTRGKTPADLLD